jgi:hypothetical protein
VHNTILITVIGINKDKLFKGAKTIFTTKMITFKVLSFPQNFSLHHKILHTFRFIINKHYVKKNQNQRYAILGMIKTMKLLLEGATRKVDDFGEL